MSERDEAWAGRGFTVPNAESAGPDLAGQATAAEAQTEAQFEAEAG